MSLTEQQLTERKKWIGASDIGSLFNIGYGCRLKLYNDKMSIPATNTISERSQGLMDRGSELEPLIYAKLTAHKYKAATLDVETMHDGALGCRNDGAVYDLDDVFGIVEIKTMNYQVYKDYTANGLPEHYIYQCVAELGAWRNYHTRPEFIVVAVLCVDTWELSTFEIELQPDLYETIVSRAAEFWANHIEAKAPPVKLEERTKACNSCLWRGDCYQEEEYTQEGVIESEEICDQVKARNDLKQLQKDVKAEIDSINTNLLIFAEANKAKKVKTSAGNFSVVQTIKNTFDSAAFKKEHAELQAQYTKPVTSKPYIR